MKKTKRLYAAIIMLIVSAIMLGTASYAWFAMNTSSVADGFEVEAYSDSLFLEISKNSTDYTTNTTFTTNNVGSLRLVTHKFFDYSEIVTLNPSGIVDKAYAGETTPYYEMLASEVDAVGKNYRYINDKLVAPTSVTGNYKDLIFVVVASDGKVTGTYYEKINNGFKATEITDASAKGYYAVSHYAKASGTYESATDTNTYYTKTLGQFAVASVSEGADLGDYYKVVAGLPAAEVAGAVYDGESTYYELSGTTLSIKGDVNVGTSLNEYYTLEESSVNPSVINGQDKAYYLKNTIKLAGGGTATEYSYIGTLSDTQILANYLYWGRAYSNDPTKVEENNTLSVLSTAKGEADYYLYNTLYLRQAEGTNHAENLRVNDVKVGGAYNELTPAMRVLFVATSSTSPNTISTALYDAGADKFVKQNADGSYIYTTDSTGEIIYEYEKTDILYTSLLGNEAETVKVEVYIYFDGTDGIAKNTDAILNGQTVEIEFTIDELDYNEGIFN